MDETTILERMGAALRTARKVRGLTQAALAERARLPRLKVIKVERGDPSVAVLAYAKLAAALDQEFVLSAARRPTLDELRSWKFDD